MSTFHFRDRQADCRLAVADGRVSFTDAGGALGWEGLGFAATLDGRARSPVAVALDRPAARARARLRLTLHLRYETCPVEETVRLDCRPAGRILIVERRLTNRGERSVAVVAVTDGCGVTIRFPTAGAYDLVRVGHPAHVRTEHLPHSRAEYPFIREIPCARTRYGDAEDQPLPVLFFCDGALRTFLYEASLLFAPFRRCWDLEGSSILETGLRGSPVAHYAGQAMDPQRVPKALAPGESFTASRMLYQIRKDGEVDRLHDDYVKWLEKPGRFRGPGSSLRGTAVFCTWNYGVYRAIDRASLLRRARFIRERVPEISFFQIDDGYQKAGGAVGWDAGKWYPDPAGNYDTKRFPGGLKRLARDIRDAGLRPAIWWTPAVALAGRLALERPEWLARTPDGHIWTIDDKGGALDFARQDVRAFTARVLDFLFGECGFEGMKLDFWSNAFASLGIRQSGHPLESRAWLLGTIRQRLPPGGFLDVCCSTAMGEPGLAEQADAYRCGVDIGGGNWMAQKIACCWVLPLLAIPGNRVMFTNMDSLGIDPGAPRNENRFRLIWCFITQGMLEVGGRLERLSRADLDDVRRVLRDADRGYGVRCPDARAFTGEPFPQVLYVDYPAASPTGRRGVLKHIALFNWGDAEDVVALPFARCGLRSAALISDFWTGAPVDYPAQVIVEPLPPHSARLLEVRRGWPVPRTASGAAAGTATAACVCIGGTAR